MQFSYPGWTTVHADDWVTIEKNEAPPNCRGDGLFVPGYFREFAATGMTDEQVWRRVFVTQQFLIDHEHREQFLVDGVRVLDPHATPQLAGQQHEWFVGRESALKGF